MIRIKSITDVITNSSTEVYTYFDEDGLEKIKEIVNTIILVSEGHGTFDGYFEIGFVLAPGEDEVIKYLCENEEKPVPDDLLEIYKVIINDNTIPLKEEYSNSFGYFILNNNIILIPRIYKTDFWYKIYLNRKKYNCNTLVSSKCFFILIYINLL